MFADGREELMPKKRIYIEVSLNGEMYENEKSIAIEEIRFCGFLIWYQGTYTQEGGTITTTLKWQYRITCY